ncbi:MAG: hypothetical protein Q9159_002970 [Coniocarpon cinnabarinum]
MGHTEAGSVLLQSLRRILLRSQSSAFRGERHQLSKINTGRALLYTASARHADVQQIEPVQAAPPIDFDRWSPDSESDGHAHGAQISMEKFRKLRIVPSSSSYFTRRPLSTDDFISLQIVLHRWQRLPTLKQSEAPRAAWMSFPEYKAQTGNENVKERRYGAMIQMLRRLNLIIPEMRPQEVVDTIDKYKRDIDPSLNQAKPILIDEWGRARAVGRRKASSAQVFLVEGEGDVRVNGKTLVDTFARVHDRESAVWALKATDRVDKYNVWAIVHGGGTTGQAEALTLGIAKALIAHEPLLKSALRKGESGPFSKFQDTSSTA